MFKSFALAAGFAALFALAAPQSAQAQIELLGVKSGVGVSPPSNGSGGGSSTTNPANPGNQTDGSGGTGTDSKPPKKLETPAPIAPAASDITHKHLITVKTYIRDGAGKLKTVSWDYTTHVWNPTTKKWDEIQWGATYIRTIQGLKEQGWSAYDAERTGSRTVTGTW